MAVGLLARTTTRNPDAHRSFGQRPVQQVLHNPCFERGEGLRRAKKGTATQRQHIVRCSSHLEFLYSAHCDRLRAAAAGHYCGVSVGLEGVRVTYAVRARQRLEELSRRS